jgi:hypothetical protein
MHGIPPPSALSDDTSVAHISTVPPEPVSVTSGSSPPDNPDAIVADDEEISFPQVIANLIAVEVACLSIHSDTQ